MNRFILLLLVCFTPVMVQAQTQWLDEEWSVTSKEKATFYAPLPYPKQGKYWLATIYFKANGKLRFKGQIDKPTMVDDNSVMVDKFTYYFENGSIEAEGVKDEQGQFDGKVMFYDRDIPGKLREVAHYKHGKQDGLTQIFYDSGKVYSETYYKEDNLDGPTRKFLESGQVISEDHFVKGEIDGVSKKWYDNGQIMLIGHYKASKREGEELRYYDNGDLDHRYRFKNDQRSGIQETFYSQNKLKTKENYIDRKLVHRIRYDEDDGKVWSETRWEYGEEGTTSDNKSYSDGKLTGRVVKFKGNNRSVTDEYSPNGKLISHRETVDHKTHGELMKSTYSHRFEQTMITKTHYVKGIRQGKYSVTTEQGVEIEKGQYQNDRPVGKWVVRDGQTITHKNYNSQGQKDGDYLRQKNSGELLSQGRYQNDIRVGRWEERDSHYHTVSHFDKQGQLDGELRKTTVNGQLLVLEHYSHGTRNGLIERYNDDLTLRDKGMLVMGVKDGPWFEWGSKYGSGVQSQGTYNKGVRVGRWLTLSSDGYELTRSFYDDTGQLDGVRYEMELNGALSTVEHYAHGKLDGKQTTYQDGAPINVRVFQQGTEISANTMK